MVPGIIAGLSAAVLLAGCGYGVRRRRRVS
jgi:LPXTG-motif cell wall-anchored protein